MTGALLHERYQLGSEIGRGGFGVVYRAADTLLKRDVAVKVLAPSDLGSQGAARLLHEAQAAAQLNHPNIVAVYDAGEQDGSAYIVMEFVEGETLQQRQVEGLDEIVSITRQVCSALEHAHSHGIVHRDLKPENVIFEKTSGGVKLMDFGLAHSSATRVSVEGTVAGTVFYLAPELALGQPFDGRADLYALGVMLYELLAGRLPFLADDPLAVIAQHLHAPIVPPRAHRETIPPALDALVVGLLSKRPEDRPASAGDVLRALDALEAGLPEAHAVKLPLLEWIARGRLVGRGDELSLLREHWAFAQAGHAHLVLISGEPGVGKTRLAEELVVITRMQGAWVLKGGCYEYEATIPYLPVAEALREWVGGQPEAELRERLGTAAVELSRLAPEIDARLGPLPPNPPLTPDEERLRLFDSLARFLTKLAAERGVLLVMDDLHWADRGTLSLLHFLLRRLRSDRVLILGAYREVELDRTHPLAEALVEWNRERAATRLQLGRLSREACSSLLAGMFGQQSISNEFSEAIYKETEGNPFFIEEVIKALIEGGQIYRQSGAWERQAIEELAIPQSIKEAIGRRLNRLSSEGTEALQVAAVLGKTFEFNELLTALEPDGSQSKQEGTLLDLLDEALSAQLIRAGGGESFAFTHDKIREVLYEELNPVRRRRMHLRVAEGLERVEARPVQDLAHHYLQAGELKKGLHYARLAGEQANQLYAYDEALRYYQQALECAEGLDDPADQIQILRAIGELHHLKGTFYPGVESFQRALQMEPAPWERAVLKTKIGGAYAQVGDERGLRFLEEALQELDPVTQADDLANNLATLGRYQHFRAQHGRAIEYLQRALELAEPLDQPFTLAHVYSYLAGAHQHMLNMEESTRWARRSIDLGERKDYPFAVATGAEFLAEDYATMGRWKESLEYAEQDRQIGEKIGAVDRIAWAGYSKAFALYAHGELAPALREAVNCLALAEQIADHRLVIWGLGMQGLLELERGNLDLAWPSIERAIRSSDQLGQIIMQCWAGAAQGSFLLKQEDWQGVITLHARYASLYAPSDNRFAPLLVDRMRVQALLGLRKLDEAGAAAEAYLALSQLPPSGFYGGIALRLQSQVFAAQGAVEQAQAACEQSVSVLEAYACLLELGRSLQQRAALQRAAGRLEAAQADLLRARELFETCGARGDLDSVNRLG